MAENTAQENEPGKLINNGFGTKSYYRGAFEDETPKP
jgi:hypothetical protein